MSLPGPLPVRALRWTLWILLLDAFASGMLVGLILAKLGWTR
jgi:hypothetical protein